MKKIAEQHAAGGDGYALASHENQQKEMKTAMTKLSGEGQDMFDELVPIADNLEKMGVVNNPNTPLTIHSVRAHYESLKDFVGKGIKDIEEQILASSSQGLTQDQVRDQGGA